MNGSIRVLYVDDEPDLLQIGQLFLEGMGDFSVETRESAREGLEALRSSTYDAVVSDYQMPHMDGIGFLKEVRGAKNPIPFILFTGRGREEIVIQALNEGADFYLQKGGEPVAQFTELAHKIRLAVHGRRAEASIRDHERREADIINFLPDATFAIDSNGIVIAWNRAMEDFSGLLAHEILGKGNYEYSISIYGERRPVLIDLVLHDDQEAEKKYPYILRSGRKLFSEIFLPQKNGGKGAFIWFTASPLYDNQGNVAGAIESIRDVTERKQIESGILDANEAFSQAQEMAHVGSWQYVLATNHVEWSDETCRIFGYEPGQFSCTVATIRQAVHPDDLGRYDRILEAAKKTGKYEPGEYRIIRPDGSIRVIYGIGKAYRDSSGSVTKLIGVIHDITDQRKAEEEIRFRNLILATQQETSPDAILIVDTRGYILQFNRKFLEIWKIPPDLVSAGKPDEPALQYVTGQCSDPETFLSRVRYLYDHPEEKSFEELSLRDGRILERFSAPMQGSDGKNYGRVWYFRDITERKRAGEALLREKTFTSAIFDSIPGMIYLYDEDGSLVRWNRKHETMTGYSAAELSRMRLLDWYKGDAASQAAVTEGLERTMRTGFGDAEALLQKKDGSTIPMYFTASPLTIDGKRYFTGIGIDITGRREIEQALKASEEMYRTVLDNIQDVFYRSDEHGRLVMASRSLMRVFGYESMDDCIGKDIAETFYLDPASRADFMEAISRKGYVENYEAVLKKKDGTPVVVSTNSHFYYHPDGSLAGIEGILRDVTALREAQDNLSWQARSLAIINDIITTANRAENLPELLKVILDSTLRLLGYEAGGIYLISPEKGTAVLAHSRNVPATLLELVREIGLDEEPYAAIFRRSEPIITNHYAEAFPAHYQRGGFESLAAVPLVAGSRVIGALTVASVKPGAVAEEERRILLSTGRELGSTISRMMAEDALRDTEEKYRAVFETTGTAMVVLEQDGTISLANDEFSRLTGFARHEIENRKKWMDFVLAEDLARMTEQHRLRRKDPGRALVHYEFKLVPWQGPVRDIYLTIGMIPQSKKSVASLLDITERKASEAELFRKTEELHAANEQIMATEEELRANFTELAFQEKQARASARQFSDIIEFLPDATFAIDKDGTVIAWNQAIETMSGIDKSAMLGKGHFEYSYWLYHEYCPILIDMVIRDNPAAAKKYPVFRRENDRLFAEVHVPHLHDGRGGDLWFTASPLYNPDGTIAGAIESIREITEHREREAALVRKNDEIASAYAQLAASEEELRQQVEEIAEGQAALRASEERYRNILEDQTEFISRFLPDGTHVFVNDAYCRYFGVSRENVIGHRFRPEIHPEDRQQVLDFFASLTRENPVGTIEHRIIMPDGSMRWQWWSDRAIFGTGGKLIEYQSVGRDITRQKEAELGLQKMAAEYEDILCNMQEVYYKSNLDGNLVVASRSLTRLFGYEDVKECIGKPTAGMFYINPGDREAFVAEVLKNGSVTDYELTLKRKNGSLVPVSTSSHIWYDRDGNVKGIEGTFRDMTSRKEETDSLIRAGQRLIDIISFLPDATFAIDRDGRVIAWNRAMEELTGYAADSMIGKNNYEYALPLYGRRRPMLIDLVFSSDPEAEKNYSMLHRDGEILTAETTVPNLRGKEIMLWGKASPLYNSRGEITGAIESVRDVTERILLQRSLQQLNRKLNLMGSITRHDINNQLSTQLAYIRLLEKSLPDSGGPYLEKIVRAAQLISAMIRFTKQYEAIGVNAPDWQDLRTLIKKAADEAGLPFITIQDDIPEGTSIYADPLVEKVIYNLVDNAARHGGKVTKIRFSSRREEHSLVVVCEDDGMGILADEKEQIFRRGYGKNTGLGLALSKEILDITGISITENGEAGKGARFEIIIPDGAFRASTP